MRKYIFSLLCLFSFSIGVFALYEPKTGDRSFVVQVQDAVTADVTSDANPSFALVQWYYAFQEAAPYYAVGTKPRFVVDALLAFLQQNIDIQKQSVRDQLSVSVFFDTYWLFVNTQEKKLPDECFTYYKLIDDAARALNVPPALIIATWYIERGCHMSLPSNGYGPFQITKNNYGTGDISQSLLLTTIQDFASFSQNKWSKYTTANAASGFAVALTYTGFSYTDLVRHGALYNGLSGYTLYGDAQPLNPDYVFGNFSDAYSGSRYDGLLVNFLKVLAWEKEQRIW